MENIKELLNEEICNQINKLPNMTLGSEEHSVAVKSITELYQLRIDEIKAENDRINSANLQAADEQLKKDQLSEQIKDRYFKLGMGVAELVLPLAFYAAWMKKGFKFEENGTFTSTTFRGLFGKFKPTKK